MLLLKVAGAVIALIIGVWLGLPGQDQPTAEDIDKILDQPGRKRRTVRRVRTPLDWFRRSKRSPDRLSRHHFRLTAPDQREGQREDG